jgi:hypothetical protein
MSYFELRWPGTLASHRHCFEARLTGKTNASSVLLWSTAVAALVAIGCRESTFNVSQDHSIDLGILDSDTAPTYVFTIQNDSGKAFTVTSFHRNCGCHDTDIKIGKTVQPGEVLAVGFSLSKYRGGAQTGQLIVSTDSPVSAFKDIVLTLKATLPRPLWTEPAAITFVAGDRETTQRVTIRSELPGLLAAYQGVDTSRALVEVRLVEQTDDSLVFEFAVRNAVLTGGDAFDFVVFEFDDQRYPMHTIQVRSRASDTIRSESLSSLQ